MTDRTDEIRKRCDAGRTVRITDVKYLLGEIDRLNALHKREIIVTGEYAQRVIALTARAEAAEARTDAAVEDLNSFARFEKERCAYCIHDNECEPGEMLCSYKGYSAFEWRGLVKE